MFESFAGAERGHARAPRPRLAIAFGFEFVNGFHDTANAVATVIYTRSLRPGPAAVWFGVGNAVGDPPRALAPATRERIRSGEASLLRLTEYGPQHESPSAWPSPSALAPLTGWRRIAWPDDE